MTSNTKTQPLAAGDYYVIKGQDTPGDNDKYTALLNPKRSDYPILTAIVNPHEIPDDAVWDAGRAGGIQRVLGPETAGVDTEALADVIDRFEDVSMLKRKYCTALVAEIYAGGIDARHIIKSVESVSMKQAGDIHSTVTRKHRSFTWLKNEIEV